MDVHSPPITVGTIDHQPAAHSELHTADPFVSRER
jgi:hypothetical protein